ncbi:MAG TPA: hypothetical protein VK808_03815 [Bacteroidia bacterium]|jgi:hypothetical protein|nr:hypothetical protein [Bacteroidia bacterium]
MKTFYLLTGSVFSFIYLFAGIMLITGKLDFGLEPNTRLAFGSAICAYGLFRVYMFYRRLRSYRNDENL